MTWTTGNAQVDDVLNTWLNRKFVDDLTYELQHQKFTADAMIPKGGGSAARYIDYAPPGRNTSYAAGNTQLPEGNTGSAHEITGITMTPTTVTVTEFGEHIKIGTLYDFASMPGTKEQTIKRLTDGAKLSLDEAVRVEANLSTALYHAVTSQAGASTTANVTPAALGAAALITVKGALKANLIMGVTGKEGHPDRQYAAVLTPTQETDITTEVTTGRVYWSNAVVNVPGMEGQLKFVNGYIGSIYGVATYITQNFVTATMTTAGNVQVGYVYGADAVAAVAFSSMKPEIIINDVNSPYKNLNSIAWHANFGAKLISLNPGVIFRVVKIYSAT